MLAIVLVSSPVAHAQPGTVEAHQKISDTEGNFTGELANGDLFGTSVAAIGDVNNDGVGDLIVGAVGDADAGLARGAVWILFMNADGTVASQQKISSTVGGFTGDLDNFDDFGIAVAGLGDLNNDGVEDVAVGAGGDDDGGANRGAVWILFLNADGTVDSHQKISATEGGFSGIIGAIAVANIGDLDGDGVTDIAAGYAEDDDGGIDTGSISVLLLNADGTVKSQQKISNTEGGFAGALDEGDKFGASIARLDDLDGDGVNDLVVGAVTDSDGADAAGAVWVLFLNTDGTVDSYQKISATEGGFGGSLAEQDLFGSSVASLGDLDGDGVGDIAVGAPMDGTFSVGATWIVLLNDDGTVKAEQKISESEGDLDVLGNFDFFGRSMVAVGDLNGDGLQELAVGADGDNDGGNFRGAVYILYLEGTSVSNEARPEGTPGVYTLSAAAPNPFRTQATLTLRIATTQHVRAEAYDALGRRLAVLHDAIVPAESPMPLMLDAAEWPAGPILVRLIGEHFTATRSVTHIR